jgi:predicted Zn-dependent protease
MGYRLRNLDTSVEKTQRTFIKLSLGALAALVVLVAVIWGGRGLYVRWQERRLIRRAVTSLQQHDLRSAGLAARTVLQLKPSSAAAARIVAEVCERSSDRAALDWRRKVVQLEPQSVEDRLAWARCALQFNDAEGAANILRDVDETGRQTAGYHAVAALLAQAQRHADVAAKEWSEAVRLSPNEKTYQLQLGVARLNSKEPNEQQDGAAMLQQLRGELEFRAAATRQLINSAIAQKKSAADILALSGELAKYPEATFTDRLLYVDLLHQAQDARFAAALTELEKRAADKGTDLAQLLSWMAQAKLNLVALDFAKTLPDSALRKWPVPASLADIYVRLGDWPKLEAAVKNANWGEYDFLRRAYLARAYEQQDNPAGREREWAAALKGAAARTESAVMLLRTISEWRWESEMVDVLWALSAQREKQNEAFITLYRYYAKGGDTRGLYKVLSRLYEADPTNRDVQNNLAQVSLLLNVDVDQARRLAADVYKKAPANPAYATTYAYSLLRDGEISGALRVMNSLTQEQLRQPTNSAYFGVCLAQARDQRAKDFLEVGKTAPNLLPEEKELIARAEQMVK